MVFETGQSWTNCVLMFLLYIPDDSSPLCCFLPPRAEGYSVLLFEVDICIIRLRCSIVSRSPIRGCSRGERVLSSPTMAASPPLSPSTQPAPASHPAVRPQPAVHVYSRVREGGRERQERGGERNRKAKKEGAFKPTRGVGGQGLSKIFKHAV